MRFTRMLTVALAYCATSIGHTHNSTVLFNEQSWNGLPKRWLSVSDSPQLAEGTTPGPEHVYAWPVVCNDPVIQPIYYCYKDARPLMNLRRYVDRAIQAWAPAMAVSSLRILPDPRCAQVAFGSQGDTENCICSQMPPKQSGEDHFDTLMISDTTKDNDDAHNKDSAKCSTNCKQGYSYHVPGEPKRPFRHVLRFCYPERLGTMTIEQENEVQAAMTHEVGE